MWKRQEKKWTKKKKKWTRVPWGNTFLLLCYLGEQKKNSWRISHHCSSNHYKTQINMYGRQFHHGKYFGVFRRWMFMREKICFSKHAQITCRKGRKYVWHIRKNKLNKEKNGKWEKQKYILWLLSIQMIY